MINLIKEKKHTNTTKEIKIKKGIRQYLPIVKEWNNSIYNYNKNKATKTLLTKDKSVYTLFNSYFNLKKTKKLKKRKFSIIKVFISKQDIKHVNNNVYITLCLFNKEKVSYKNIVFKLYRKALLANIKNLNTNFNLFIIKFLFKFNNKNLSLLLKYKKHYTLHTKYFFKKYKKLFNLRKTLIKLKFINYKYNINNFLGLNNILQKIYNKKIEFNIINLKHIYLDSNILTEAIGAKLKNRKANLLKNIIKSIYSVKIPNIEVYEKFNKAYTLDLNILLTNPNIVLKNDIGKIKDSIYISMEKLSIAIYKLKNKIVKGIRIQGSGRLTKRLTALRSVSKFTQKGSLKNIYSSHYNLSTVVLVGYIKSNLQYIKKNYNNRNGSYGVKTHISSY